MEPGPEDRPRRSSFFHVDILLLPLHKPSAIDTQLRSMSIALTLFLKSRSSDSLVWECGIQTSSGGPDL